MNTDMSSAFKFLIYLAIFVLILVGLSNVNFVARNFGGEVTITLEPNRKLVNATWKNSSLWILTKEMNDNDKAEIYKFIEDSNFGILEGKVIIVESKQK